MGGGLQGFQRVGKFYQDAREIGNMEVCNGCENTVVSGTNFCPHCGSKIENIVEITEKISTIEPLAENGINEDDDYIENCIGSNSYWDGIYCEVLNEYPTLSIDLYFLLVFLLMFSNYCFSIL